MTALRLFTLGTAELRRIPPDGAPQVLAISGKPFALLCRLAFSNTRALSRDVLAEDIWSELDPARSKAQLRTALWSLRKQLGDDALRADDTTISLVHHVGSDRADLEAAIRAKDRTAAVKLYRGDFLAHFAISDARGFEEWAEFERRNLRGLFLAAVDAEVAEMLGGGRFSQAVDLARRARDIEPLRQEAWRLLITALATSGDAVSTRAEAGALAEMLRAEGLAPDDATQRVVRSAMSVKEPPRDSGADESLVADLVGRERELATLLTMSDAIDRRTPRAAHIVGPAGIGKTRLLRDFERAARFRNRQVVFVGAVRGTARISWGGIARIAERLAALPGALGINEKSAGVLVGLNPALSATFHGDVQSPADGELARELMIAIAELVKAIAEERPLVLIVDDAQWLDAASRELVESLPRLCESSALLVVLGERDTSGTTSAAPPFVPLALGPLSAVECEALAASIATLPDESWCRDWIDALRGTSGGVPLAVLDLLHLAVEQNRVAVRDGSWYTESHEALVRLTDETAPRKARMRHLTESALQFATLVAVGGAPLELAVARRVLSLPPEELDRAIDELTRRGMATAVNGIVALEHEEYGRAARDASPVEQQRGLALSLAQELLQSDDPERLRRAYMCAENAGNVELPDVIAKKYVRVMRARFPHRSVRDVVSELIGLGTRAERLQHIEELVGASARLRRRALAVGATFAVILSIVFGAALARRAAHAAPDATVEVVIYDSTGDISMAESAVDLSSWIAGRPIRVDASSARRIGRAPARELERNPIDGRSWVGVREHSAPNLEDIVLFNNDGTERDLAPAPGDDVSPNWSPDGKSLVFVTARYTGKDWSDLATIEVASEKMHRLGGGPGRVTSPAYSDDGQGVVFFRESPDRQAHEVCVLSLTATAPKCRSFSAPEMGIGKPTWPDPATVMLGVIDLTNRRSRVLSWNPELDIVREIAQCRGALRDGESIRTMVICDRDGDPRKPEVAPLSRPDAWRPIDVRGAGNHAFNIALQDQSLRLMASAKLRIVGSRNAVVGVPHQLKAVIERADSSTVPSTGVVWDTDAKAATIDEHGVLSVGIPGAVLVHARLASGAHDSLRIEVHMPNGESVSDEHWDPTWLSRWRRFGLPRSVVVRDGTEFAFWNFGDGSYFSGVYSNEKYPTDEGLAIDAMLSTPINAEKWQKLYIGFVAIDDGALSRWDHRSGYLPGGAGGMWCAFEYPADPEGPAWGSLYRAGNISALAIPDQRTGKDYRVRMQIFPDGRCGMALNGRAMVVAAAAAASSPVRAITYGSSVGTRMLVKKLTVTRGVAAGVDWGKVMK